MSNKVTLQFAGDSKGATQAADEVENRFAEMGKNVAKTVGAGLAVAGGLAAAGFVDSFERQDAKAKLQAQLGGDDPKWAAMLGGAAGSLYAKAYGENLGEVSEAVRLVTQNIGLGGEESQADIEALTQKTMSLAKAFDKDVSEASMAAGQMVKTGLAKNSEEALDILTRGFQRGGDKAGDMLDVINEFGVQFQSMGINGEEMIGLFSQGLQAGARDTAVISDAFKQFSVLAMDGSDATKEAFKSMGLDADEMQKKIAAGGASAKEGLDQSMDALRGMKDPAQQSAAAIALFGSGAEDLKSALLAMDLSYVGNEIGTVTGAAGELDKTLGDTASNKVLAMQRGFEEWRDSIVGVDGPLGDVATGVMAFGGDAMAAGSQIAMMVTAIASFGGFAKIATAAQWLWNAAMSANPIGLIVLAIAALVAGFIWAWNNIDGFKEFFIGVWEKIKEVFSVVVDFFKNAWETLLVGFKENIRWVGEVWDAVWGFIKGVFETYIGIYVAIWNGFVGAIKWALDFVGNIFSTTWNGIKGGFEWAVNALVTVWGWFYNPIKDGIDRLGGFFSGLWDGIKGAARSAFNFVADIWNSTVGRLNFTVPDWVPGIGGARFAVPSIPKFHTGGVFPGTQGSEGLALLQAGERITPATGNGGGAEIVFGSDGSELGDAILAIVLRAIAKRGGDPKILGV